MLINLVANAIKFTFNGQITVSVEKIQHLLRFTVRDTGIGMNEQQMRSIFTFFKTFDKSKGYGLGLAFAKCLVGRLGPEENIDV